MARLAFRSAFYAQGKDAEKEESAVKTALAMGPDSCRKELEGAIMTSPNIRPQGMLSKLHTVLKNGISHGRGWHDVAGLFAPGGRRAADEAHSACSAIFLRVSLPQARFPQLFTGKRVPRCVCPGRCYDVLTLNIVVMFLTELQLFD